MFVHYLLCPNPITVLIAMNVTWSLRRTLVDDGAKFFLFSSPLLSVDITSYSS